MRDFPYYYEIKPGSQVFQGCPGVRSCTVATDSNVPADLVILFSTNSNSRNYTSPPPRPANQIWAYFAVEAPPHSYSSVLGSPAWRLYFNWTMTYRLDSDIRFGYGIVVKTSNDSGSSDHKTYDESALMKKIRELCQGWTFTGPAGRSVRERIKQLLRDAGTDYFFYLAFENSLCTDYVTEKAFLTLKYDVVPVVRGGANYSSLVPPMSVIDTSAFQSILDLGRYLQYLKDNPTEYLRYLRWKKDYVIVEPQPLPWCELCSKVHEATYGKQRPQAYVNVNSWWVDGTCRQANDLHIYGQF
ncbi:alpha-(1,3)-fucosyltransferase C-like [Pomacea canaliculata]|uniref:alpha-(1,3)-fucosyltransferase C-like n=1 Tax=Pomacea canaliculata TaxID=400727 RepID=UPI000D725E9B|nr:alpha-(1,3)-fucosyltransferase C-like [Pomacea canaliculata]